MKVEQRNIGDVKPYARNPRINDNAVDAVAESIKQFGFRQPIVVDKHGVVICGHTRLKAALKLGLKKVPVHVATDLTAQQIKAYRIADNKSAELAEWDLQMLPLELSELDEQFDMSLLGFSQDELEQLLHPTPQEIEDVEPKIDQAEQLQAKWKTERGQIWEISGQQTHRLMCGDATSANDVASLLKGNKPFIMVTDPPYGVEYDPQWRNDAAARGHISHAGRRVGNVTNDDRLDWTEAYQLSECVVAYCWHAGRYASEVAEQLSNSGYIVRCQIIWSKPRFAISRGHYHWQHEPCWYAVRKGSNAKWSGDRSQTTLWQITNVLAEADGKSNHGTQKPLECMARPVRNHGARDDAVYDPFVGSGTTLLAAERLDRSCYAMEISPGYVAVTLQRMQDAGCTCTLVSDAAPTKATKRRTKATGVGGIAGPPS